MDTVKKREKPLENVELKARSFTPQRVSYGSKNEDRSFFVELAKSQKGEVTMLAMFLSLILLLSITYSMRSMIINHKMIQHRLETYTCFHDALEKIRDTYNFIYKSNIAIIGFNAAKAVNPLPHWEVLIRATQVAQQAKTFRYFKKLITSNKCHSLNKLKIYQAFPYKLNKFKILTRGLGGVALCIKPKASLKITARKKMLPIFTLHASYRMKTMFKIIKTMEKTNIGGRLGSLPYRSSLPF